VSEGLELAQRALAAVDGDEADVLVEAERSGLARFASSRVHQPTLIENAVVTLRVVRDGRVGVASGNDTADEALRALARRAAEIADNSPPDPDFPGLAPPADPPAVEGLDEETAELDAADQARLATAAIEAARPFELYGYFTSGLTTVAVTSTTGVAVEQRLTDARVLALAAGDDASGYADSGSWRVGGIDPVRTAEEAAAKAGRTRGAQTLEPAPYRAVLEPYAIAELLQSFVFDAFNGLSLVEERSFVAGKLGERLFDEKVSLADDALDPRGLPKAFDFEGVPKQRVELVRDGVATGVVWDRYSAARAGGGQVSTGHAVPPGLRAYGALPFAPSLAGGDAASFDELAELVGDGIYVTRLHYLNTVDARQGVITGMTRDGTFRIRDGKVAEPLVNLRFTVSVPELLADVPGLTRETTLVDQSDYYDERYPTGVLCPGIATGRFNITGVGSRPGL
jgi:PmbA protein